jgi:hypothetical protein
MTTPEQGSTQTPRCTRPAAGRAARLVLILGIAALVWALAPLPPAYADDFCSRTAVNVLRACSNEARDDFWITRGNCINISNEDERADCREEAWADWRDAREECREQYDARLELCAVLGEARYDPAFDPADFETEFTGLNPYFPLVVGNSWTYVAGDETITVEVLDETKLIEGVTCIVVNDLVEENGETIEDTDDWYGQATNGDVHYCGEIALNFETFDGDDPEEPELVDIEGSWKAGRDHAKPGIIMFALPMVGTVYRQEVALGDAEDVAEILSIDYGYGDDPDLDQLVPQDLAELLCNDNCVVTRDFTPIEPGVEERKYYAPGIGPFLEVNLEEGNIVQLVACNVDPLCAMLPPL